MQGRTQVMVGEAKRVQPMAHAAAKAATRDSRLTVLGFMTGTSLDAVDVALVETDGRRVLRLGPCGEMKLDSATRTLLEQASKDALHWDAGGAEPRSFGPARRAVTRAHVAAARPFLAKHEISSARIDLVGVHGQTVLHEAPRPDRPGRSIQLIDAQALADALGLPVAHDFRAEDVRAGGQGAPLAPVYHAALAEMSGLEMPVAVLNLGGIANITLIRSDGSIEAFDSGPANGMIDLLVQARTARRMDAGGALALSGTADQEVIERYLRLPYFAQNGARSLDRFDFPVSPVDHLALEDAAATLTAFAAEAVARGLRGCSERPKRLIACGGGRHNPALMEAIGIRADVPLVAAEEVGWRGDSIEAEAFAFLAARCALNLPVSFPETTGVPEPQCGGLMIWPRG
jgi:anhydro-N-acetylmuramic acid kinase